MFKNGMFWCWHQTYRLYKLTCRYLQYRPVFIVSASTSLVAYDCVEPVQPHCNRTVLKIVRACAMNAPYLFSGLDTQPFPFFSYLCYPYLFFYPFPPHQNGIRQCRKAASYYSLRERTCSQNTASTHAMHKGGMTAPTVMLILALYTMLCAM